MDDLLKNPVLISASIMSLGIGFPILIAYLRGYLPTRTQDKEKSERIAYLQRLVEEKDMLIGDLPTRSEIDSIKGELQTVRSNLRRDLLERDKVIADLNVYTRQLIQDVLNQQKGIQSVTATLATLAQQLPVLVFSIQDLVSRERQIHGNKE